jgi:hypothetical protein
MRSGTERRRQRFALQDGQVVAWRRSRLLDAGFPRALAEEVAVDAEHDLHALIELVERGCPPELAVRILMPLDRRKEE